MSESKPERVLSPAQTQEFERLVRQWVYLEYPETNSGPCRYPNDPTVVEVLEGKGWVVCEHQPADDADDLAAEPEQPEQPAEPAKKTSKAAASATTKEE